MANMEKIRALKPGEDVTVITSGEFQLVDVAGGRKYPPLTECTGPATQFVFNQLRLGNLVFAGDKGAPEAKGKALSGDELFYNATGLSEPKPEAAAPKSEGRKGKSTPKGDNSSTGNEAFTSTSAEPERAKTSDE